MATVSARKRYTPRSNVLAYTRACPSNILDGIMTDNMFSHRDLANARFTKEPARGLIEYKLANTKVTDSNTEALKDLKSLLSHTNNISRVPIDGFLYCGFEVPARQLK